MSCGLSLVAISQSYTSNWRQHTLDHWENCCFCPFSALKSKSQDRLLSFLDHKCLRTWGHFASVNFASKIKMKKLTYVRKFAFCWKSDILSQIFIRRSLFSFWRQDLWRRSDPNVLNNLWFKKWKNRSSGLDFRGEKLQKQQFSNWANVHV